MIDIKEIKKTCPKSYKLLGEWVKTQVVKFQEVMLKEGEKQAFDVPEIVIDDTMIEGVIMWNERQLFDFFDVNSIEIEIYKGWKYYITHETDEEFKSRPECEAKAFKAAFEELEKTL
jgi:hypothetical protein